MSMKGISSREPNKLSSSDLDVYFSGYNEASSSDHRHTQKYGYKAAREENRIRRWGIIGGGRRISLDLPMRCSEQVHNLYKDHHEKQEVTTIKERMRQKQPSSPGGRIASFLNSLFHQAGSKKNKSKLNDQEVEEEIPGGMRRRRRSSISHFLNSSSRSKPTTTTITTTTMTSSSSLKSLITSLSSGCRTPPPYLHTPTKNYKKFLNYTSATRQVGEEEKKTNKEFSWLGDDDRRTKRGGDDDDDDGMDSDSSSDLFELQNYELSRGGLPVYETTNVAKINNTDI